MRQRWKRTIPVLAPSRSDIETMVRAALPRACVAGAAAIDGGLANTNIRVDLEDAPHRVLLRLYQRDASQADKEAAIAHRLKGHVPVAEFLHLGEHEGQRFAMLEWIEGVTLSSALGVGGETERLGQAAGETLARIHAVRFPRTGFLDGDLNIAPFTADGAFVIDYLRGSFIEGGGARFVPRELADAVIAYVERNRRLEWGAPPSLIHCDYNGSNILVRDGTIAAVVDWEFAFAGPPAIDFGNLIRSHDDVAFQEAVAGAYRAAGGILPDDWRKQARLIDLTSWAEFLLRPEVDPTLVEDALHALRATIAE